MQCLCGRPRPDLMVPPDDPICDFPNPIICARLTIKAQALKVKETRAALLAQGELNCVLVTQNCRIIARNTALEGTIYDLTLNLRLRSADDEDLCQRSEQVARGLCDLRPSEQLK